MARKLDSTDNENLVSVSVPHKPTPAYFDQIARRAELFYEHHRWTREEVRAGRMAEERRQRNLTRLWQELLAPSELPPLPIEFTCDAVEHPPHYQTAAGIETIDVIEAFELGFSLGNAVKYILRAGKKGDRVEDLRKAAWYLAREIANAEKGDG